MYSSQEPFRTLHDALLEHRGPDTFARVLRPWLEQQEDEARFLKAFADRPGHPWPAADHEERCRIYAASRVNDVLLLAFQRDGSGWAGPPLTLDAYVAFASGLGMSSIALRSTRSSTRSSR